MSAWKRAVALCLILCLNMMLTAYASDTADATAGTESASAPAEGETPESDTSDWVTFLLICNEGMLNNGGNVGNTVMLFSMSPSLGAVKKISFLWDTFVDYPGYETPQLLDQPFRVGGPEETLKIFNENFGQEITSYLSINFLNLAAVIDTYGGVTLDVSREERNALNGMVASKAESALTALMNLGADETAFNSILEQYYLLDYGPETHLSGIQAVGYGWLQYDSVINCCMREVEVIGQLFFKMRQFVEERAVFYQGKAEMPTEAELDSRRPIDTDAMTDEDKAFLAELLQPVFNKSYHNLTDDQIGSIVEAILRSAYGDPGQRDSTFNVIQLEILPLEYDHERTLIGGYEGTVVDYTANKQALELFLRDPTYSTMIIDPESGILPVVESP